MGCDRIEGRWCNVNVCDEGTSRLLVVKSLGEE